jgi:hypothetical protein
MLGLQRRRAQIEYDGAVAANQYAQRSATRPDGEGDIPARR